MRKIELKAVVDEIEAACDIYTSFYDTETGEIVALFEEDYADENDDNEELAELLESQPDRFIRFPTRFEIHDYRIMESFVFLLDPGMVQQRLARALQGKGAFRRFKDTIIELEVEDSWYSYQAAAYREIALQWCEDNNMEIE